MPYVQNLIEGRGEPVTVYPYDSLGKAWSLMTERDFSQLPVIDEAKRPIGLGRVCKPGDRSVYWSTWYTDTS
jgi:hypothetical protein